MNRCPRPSRPRLGVLVLCVVAIVFGSGLWSGSSSGSAVGLMQRRAGNGPAASTPVATTPEADDPLDGDPLDGDPGKADPLDGESPRKAPEAPENLAQLDIERSGRPSQESRSLPTYDDDPTTVWQPDATNGASWVWFDLGAEQGVREVRWLVDGSGAVEVAVSSDRRRWEAVERVEASGGWQGAGLRENARYVRLTLLADDEGDALPGIAEVAVYGRDRGSSVSAEQEAKTDRERRRDRVSRDDEAGPRRDGAAADADASGTTGGNERTRRRGGRVQVSAEPGETRCSGDREQCRARQGEISVEEDCAADGSCTIDIRADGGTAVCDATGGDESRAGRGEGRRRADGGECEAVANGGAVAIGDINS